jgi:hypothetical protein
VGTVFKNLNISINKCLDQLVSFIMAGTNVLFKNYFIINNSQCVVDDLSGIRVASVISYDFTTLYTKIPIDLLYEVIVKLIDIFVPSDFVFKCDYNMYVIEDFLQMLRAGLDNNFIKIHNNVYQQIVGIPMGSNYSVNLANLFLFYYEYTFLSEYDLKDQYQYTFRYIDDLLAVNNFNIDNDIGSIYPRCMEVECSNCPPFVEANYLDLHLYIHNDRIKVGLYDKRRDFKFTILGFPNFYSNLPE